MAAFKVEICGVNTAKLPLLSAQEKTELLKMIKEGDKQARDKYKISAKRCAAVFRQQ